MNDLGLTAGLVIALLLCAAAGRRARFHLAERHLQTDSVESIRLLMGMLLTFAAIVLGLLTSNAKQRFDGLSASLSSYSAGLIELDGRLRAYGGETDAIRRALRQYTAAAIASSWPGEAVPSGTYPSAGPGTGGSLASPVLGALLANVQLGVVRLQPSDRTHEQEAAGLASLASSLLLQRWELVLASRGTVSWPLLGTLAAWLGIIFAIFGLTMPPTRVIYAVVALSALSIASPLYLILDYDDALTGAITLPSGAMRAALAYMDGQ